MRFFRRTSISPWGYRLLTEYANGHEIGWKTLLKSVWPKDVFGNIKQNIEKYKGLIDRGVRIQMIKEDRDFRERDRLERNILRHDDGPILNNVQSRHCAETGKWVFSDPLFKSWLGAGNEAKQRLLWLAGVPGAGNLNRSAIIDSVIADLYIGKTFLCYSILLHLQEMAQMDGSTHILYAFPTYNDTSGNTEVTIVRSLLYQLCRANPSLIPAANKE